MNDMKLNVKTILVAGVILTVLIVGGSLLMGQHHGYHWDGNDGYPWGNGHMMGYSSGQGWIMMIMMLLFWGLIVLGIIWGMRNFSRNEANHSIQPLEILKRRYVSGEIGKDEFESKKRDLL